MGIKLREFVTKHLCHIELIYQTSKKLLEAAEKKDMDSLEFYSDNRDRMVNILFEVQKKIEELIDENSNQMAEEVNEILASWKKNFLLFLKKLEDLDHQIIDRLDILKKEVSGQIAVNFKFKEQIKKYNRNDIRS